MAFKVRKTPYRAWPVTVRILESDALGVVTEIEQTFVGHFMAISEAKHQSIIEAVDAGYPLPPGQERHDMPTVLRRNADYFSRLLAGWGPEVQDENGAPLPFSAEALSAMITGPDGLAISAALLHAVNELRFGIAPAKNSKPSPAPVESSGGQSEGQTSLPPT